MRHRISSIASSTSTRSPISSRLVERESRVASIGFFERELVFESDHQVHFEDSTRDNTIIMAAALLAAGLNPAKSNIFVQSAVRDTFLFNSLTHPDSLSR